MKTRIALVNGYGVPKNVLTDNTYHAYLIAVVNHLWAHCRGKHLKIVLLGGPTDFQKPYRRTEAGEMARFMRRHFKRQVPASDTRHWVIHQIGTELTALENMLAAKMLLGQSPDWYFCEQSREKKMKVLARAVFGKHTEVVAIDFDGSRARYIRGQRNRLEKEDLAYSLRALKDPAWRAALKHASEEKIRILRQLPATRRDAMVDEVAMATRRNAFAAYRAKKRG